MSGRPFLDILVVDANVQDADRLVAECAPGTRVAGLSGQRDPLGEIADAVGLHGRIRRLAIMAHGAPGAIRLAGKTIDRAALGIHREPLSRIRAALTEDAEIIVLGCSVAAGESGRGFTADLSTQLGAPVRASKTDLGGPAAWAGLPAAAALFGRAALAAYPHRLAVSGTIDNTANSIASDAAADAIDGLDGNDTIVGNNGADTISGSGGNDSIFGGDAGGSDNAGNLIDGGTGADTITGGSLADTITGGDGTDSIQGADGADEISGGAEADTVFGQSGNDTIYGGDGDDSLNGGTGTDLIYGGAGNDMLAGSGDNDTLYGDSGDDSLTGDAGNDVIAGGAGNDLLIATSGTNSLDGGAGNDTLSGGTGADTMSGGNGDDLFRGSATDLNLDTISGLAAGDSILVTGHDGSGLDGAVLGSSISLGANTVNIAGAASNLTISASYDGSNTTLTFSAPDAESSGEGGGLTVTSQSEEDQAGTLVDRILTNNTGITATGALVENTGSGNVTRVSLPSNGSVTNSGSASAESGSAASESLYAQIQASETDAAEKAFFTGHADEFIAWKGDAPMDIRTLEFSTTGSGQTVDLFDVADESGGTQAFVLDMSNISTGTTVTLDDIDFAVIVGAATVTGGEGQNFVVGDDDAQLISLGAEDDTLAGGGGNDTVGSNWGEDLIYGNQGADSLVAGGGMDTLFGGQGSDTVTSGNDSDLVYGNKGADLLSGGEANDSLYGGQQDDLIYGNRGNDQLAGNLGSDTLYGGRGNDILLGGDGSDLLCGNTGDDTLSGGDGADIFYFSFGTGQDEIVDYVAGTDSLVFENGLTYRALENGDNTVLSLSDGASVTLIGVAPPELAATQGWDITG